LTFYPRFLTSFLRAFPLHTNSNGYQHGTTVTATAWGARQLNSWISLGGRLLFSQWGNITGKHPDLNPNMSPSHRPYFRGGTSVDMAISSNLIVPAGPLAGHRLALSWCSLSIKTSPVHNSKPDDCSSSVGNTLSTCRQPACFNL